MADIPLDSPSEVVPNKYRGLGKKAAAGSRQAAIRLFCLSCVGWDLAEVRLCTATKCPLYAYRLGGSRARDARAEVRRANGE